MRKYFSTDTQNSPGVNIDYPLAAGALGLSPLRSQKFSFVYNKLSNQTTRIGSAVNLQVGTTTSDNTPVTFTASGLPSGLSISSSGLISGTAIGNPKTYSTIITMTLQNGTQYTMEFQWEVYLIYPVLQQIPNQSDATNIAISGVQIDATHDQSLTYTTQNLPTGLSVNSGTGLITGTPTTAATYSPVWVRVTDGYAAAQTSFTWDITSSYSLYTWNTLIRYGSPSSNSSSNLHSETVNSIAFDSGGNLISGSTVMIDNYYPVLMKQNSFGDILWQKMLTSSNVANSTLETVKIDNSDNIYTLCTNRDPATQNTIVEYISKFDSNGSLVWAKSLPPYPPVASRRSYRFPRDMCIAGSSSNLVVTVAQTFNGNTSATYVNPWMICHDTDGNYMFGLISDVYYGVDATCCISTNNSILVGKTLHDLGSSNGYSRITAVDFTGTFLWELNTNVNSPVSALEWDGTDWYFLLENGRLVKVSGADNQTVLWSKSIAYMNMTSFKAKYMAYSNNALYVSTVSQYYNYNGYDPALSTLKINSSDGSLIFSRHTTNWADNTGFNTSYDGLDQQYLTVNFNYFPTSSGGGFYVSSGYGGRAIAARGNYYAIGGYETTNKSGFIAHYMADGTGSGTYQYNGGGGNEIYTTSSNVGNFKYFDSIPTDAGTPSAYVNVSSNSISITPYTAGYGYSKYSIVSSNLTINTVDTSLANYILIGKTS